MLCSVARALGSTLIILVAGANIWGYWQRVLGHCFGFHTMGCRHSVWLLAEGFGALLWVAYHGL
jgi:hypothetical protein